MTTPTDAKLRDLLEAGKQCDELYEKLSRLGQRKSTSEENFVAIEKIMEAMLESDAVLSDETEDVIRFLKNVERHTSATRKAFNAAMTQLAALNITVKP